MKNREEIAWLILIVIWFWWEASPSLSAGFTLDTIMNIWMHSYAYSWTEALLRCFAPWMPLYRGTGALFYRPVYDLFGLNPVPYHVLLLCLLTANLLVWYAIARVLLGRQAALIACLATSYWPSMSVIYYGLHTIYDVLCSLLTWLCFLIYIIRPCTWPRLVLIGILYIVALSAKEMAICLPLFILGYEWTRRESRSWRWIVALLPGTVLSLYGKLSPSGMSEHSGYRLSFSLANYLAHWNHFLRYLSDFQVPAGHTVLSIALLLAPLVLALFLRNRYAVFGWCIFVFGALPVSFTELIRDPYVLFVPFFGVTLYLGAMLAPVSPRYRLILAPLLLLLTYWNANSRGRFTTWVEPGDLPIRKTIDYLDRHPLKLRKSAWLLAEDDPFPLDDYDLQMTVSLYYRDKTLGVDRVKFGAKRRNPNPTYDATISID